MNSLSGMVGKVIIKASAAVKGAEELAFQMSDGTTYVFHNDQGYREPVVIEDVCGDISDLIGSPIIQAEEISSTDECPVDPFTGAQCEFDSDNFHTWTFYKFATIKGSVTFRWLGQSNGHYSESVDLKVFKVGEVIPRYFLELFSKGEQRCLILKPTISWRAYVIVRTMRHCQQSTCLRMRQTRPNGGCSVSLTPGRDTWPVSMKGGI